MALALLASTLNTCLLALHVNHHLRPEADTEAAQVQQWLNARGIPCEVLHWHPPATISSQQRHARAGRYALMAEACAKHGIQHLLLGHHLNDQAETLLLRLQRGSHVKGLSAMRPVSQHGKLTVLRPLLDIPKSRLTATLEALGQPWLTDPSNDSDAYLRNDLRQRLGKLRHADTIHAQLAASAAKLAALDDAWQAQADAFIKAHCQQNRCNAEAFLTLPADIQTLVLSQLLTLRHPPPRFTDLERILEQLRQGGDFRRTLNGQIITRRGKFLEVELEIRPHRAHM